MSSRARTQSFPFLTSHDSSRVTHHRDSSESRPSASSRAASPRANAARFPRARSTRVRPRLLGGSRTRSKRARGRRVDGGEVSEGSCNDHGAESSSSRRRRRRGSDAIPRRFRTNDRVVASVSKHVHARVRDGAATVGRVGRIAVRRRRAAAGAIFRGASRVGARHGDDARTWVLDSVYGDV